MRTKSTSVSSGDWKRRMWIYLLEVHHMTSSQLWIISKWGLVHLWEFLSKFYGMSALSTDGCFLLWILSITHLIQLISKDFLVMQFCNSAWDWTWIKFWSHYLTSWWHIKNSDSTHTKLIWDRIQSQLKTKLMMSIFKINSREVTCSYFFRVLVQI